MRSRSSSVERSRHIKAAATVVVFIVSAIPFAWSAGPSPLDSPRPAPAASSQEGLQGDFQVNMTEVAWLDLAFEVDRTITKDDINISVTIVWPDPEGPRPAQRWICGYLGERFTRHRPDEFSASCIMWGGSDAYWEVEGRRGKQGVGADVLHPLCHLDCMDGARFTFSTEHMETWFSYENVLSGRTKTVVHFLVATGNRKPSRVAIDGELWGTEANLTTGPFHDTETIFPEDYESGVYVRSDLPPRSVYYQKDAAYRSALTPQSRHVFFWYSPTHEWNEPYAEAGYVRPDGTEKKVCCFDFEATTLDGRWTFWFAESRSRHQVDMPNLVMAEFDWATAP